MSATVAYPLMIKLANGWEHLYPSATISGIVGDQRHAQQGGYHIGRRFQSSSNYSVIRADDRSGMGPSDASSAIDMTMSTHDIVLCTKRLRVLYANGNDPRRKYLNAFNGWLGSGSATRYDIVARKTEWATSDHKWHIHLEVRRRWVQVGSMVTAVLSALAGDSVADYLHAVGAAVPAGKSAPPAAPAAPFHTMPAPAYPGRILRRNDHQAQPDNAVKAFQARMLERGWKSIGTADGFFGAHTEDVVTRFQKSCKVGADGTIGPITWPLPWTRPLGS
jgi:peptidoglycan hydrolase-like protein with peptidoglycan-binding domain